MELLRTGWLLVRRRWLVIFAALALALVVVSLLNGMQRREYTASADLFLRAPDVKSSASAYQGDLFSKQRAQTYVSMFTSDDLAQLVVDRLGLDTPPAELAGQVSAGVITDTVLITVSVTDSNAQQAANIANAYGAVFGDYVAQVEDVSRNPDLPPLVTVVKPATADSATSGGYPLPLLAPAVTAVALLGAAAAIWALERFDDRVRSRRAIEDLTGVRVLGTLPPTGTVSSLGAAETYWTNESFAESGRRLSINVDHLLRRLGTAQHAPSLAVSSVDSGDGKSVVAAAIAHAMVNRGYTVGIVGADRNASSSHYTPESAVDGLNPHNLSVVSLYTDQKSFTERDLRDAITKLGAERDIVIVDGPAFRDASESQLIAECADAAVVVVRPGHTRTAALSSLFAALDVLDTPVIGVVANQAKESATPDALYT